MIRTVIRVSHQEKRVFSQRLHNYQWNVTRPSDRRAGNQRERGNASTLTIRRAFDPYRGVNS